MTVYIDQLKQYMHKRKRYAHMVADTKSELDQFAKECGVGKHFYHASPYPHYDISENHYQACIKHGAMSKTSRELISILKRNT